MYFQNHALYVKNVIIFIIRVLKLLVMQGKYILLALVAILILISPVCASTTKIYGGAPVFIGETNVDISKALDGCRIIGWMPEGAEVTIPSVKNITLRPVNEFPDTIFHYTFSPREYSNYTGNWYCEDKMPLRVVFVVNEPQVKIRIWDVDQDQDVTGKTIPSTANITYRIDTNLDTALQLKYRPDLTPADSFWAVKLTNPYGKGITNINTGSDGVAGTQILTFDSAPQITSTPYIWKTGSSWDLASKSKIGEPIYPPGKYTFTASQNLNGMQAIYKAEGITDIDGKLSSTADVTIEKATIVITTPTPVIPVETIKLTGTPEATEPVTIIPTGESTIPVPEKTTYAPLPAWIALAGVGVAAAFACWQRK